MPYVWFALRVLIFLYILNIIYFTSTKTGGQKISTMKYSTCTASIVPTPIFYSSKKTLISKFYNLKIWSFQKKVIYLPIVHRKNPNSNYHLKADIHWSFNMVIKHQPSIFYYKSSNQNENPALSSESRWIFFIPWTLFVLDQVYSLQS